MKLSNQDFIRQINSIPKGEHPRKDIYTKKITEEIAAVLKITDFVQTLRLRRKLGGVALLISKWRQLHGNANVERRFVSWLRQDLAKDAMALRETLDSPPDGDSRPLHSINLLDKFDGFQKSLNDLIKTVDLSIHQPRGEWKKNSRHLTEYKELIVGLLTGIYGAEFLGRRPSRIVDPGSVYGEFVDFIRTAGKPLLRLEINEDDKSFKRHIKFDRQIQAVIKPVDSKEYEQFRRK